MCCPALTTSTEPCWPSRACERGFADSGSGLATGRGMRREHCAGQSSALQGPSPSARRLLQPEPCSHHIARLLKREKKPLMPECPFEPSGGALRLQNSTTLTAERKHQAENNPRWTGFCLPGVDSEEQHQWNKTQQLSSVRNSCPLNANGTGLEREAPPGGHVSRVTLSGKYHHASSVPELFAFSSSQSLLPASCQPAWAFGGFLQLAAPSPHF